MFERTASFPWPVEWDEPDPHCRFARPEDADNLIDIYWRSELNFMPSKRALRRLYKKIGLDDIMVYDRGDGQGVLGLFGLMTRTPEYLLGGELVVDPDHRGEGISWALVSYGVAHANEIKAGVQVFVRESNPMSVPADMAHNDDDFLHIALRAPRRFKGEPRLHRLWYRLTTRDTDREESRSFTGERLDHTRRVQDAWKRRGETDSGE